MGRGIQILRQGPICKYLKNSILNEDLDWFSNNRYEIIEMGARNWNGKNTHQNLKTALSFPEYYGENMNAFRDCLSDMYSKRYQGLILVFRSYDDFVAEDRSFSEAILESIAWESREWLLTGKKLIGLVQSNDPDLHFPQLGGISPSWNGQKWFNQDRTK